MRAQTYCQDRVPWPRSLRPREFRRPQRALAIAWLACRMVPPQVGMPIMKGIFRKWWLWGLAVVLIAGAGIAWWLWPRKYKLTVSRETTVLLGPLNPDGTVNYVAALNQMYGQGVTPENNAAVLLIQATGRRVLLGKAASRVLKELGIEALPATGNYFVELVNFVPGLPASSPAGGVKTKDLQGRAEIEFRKAIKEPWRADDYPVIAKWLQANAEPLSLVLAATRRPRYHLPFVAASDPPCLLDVVRPYVGLYREIARALATRAMLHAGEGRIDEAISDLLALHRLGRLLGQGGRLLERLVGVIADGAASEVSVALATGGELSAAQARRLLGGLEAPAPIHDVVEAVDKAERFFFLDAVTGEARRSWTGHHGNDGVKINTDWDKLLRRFNYWHDMQVTAMRKPTFAERAAAAASFKSAFDQYADTLRKRAKWRLGLQNPGDYLFSIGFVSCTETCCKYDLETMSIRLAKVAVALAAWKAEKGEYPEELSEVAPEYVKKLPQDICADGPLTYRRVAKGYLLYSIGRNMTDDGGGSDDIAVRAE